MKIINKFILLLISLSLCMIGAEWFLIAAYDIIKPNTLIGGSILFTVGFIITLYTR